MSSGRSYKDSLLKSLKKDAEAVAYLDAALAENDREVFLLALRDVVEARVGGIAELAKRAGLNRESLYRMLSGQGNPALESLDAVLDAVGLRLSISLRDAG